MAHFSVSRSTTIAAEPAAVHALVEDFRQWTRWSPWEDLDPDLRRTYSGPDSGPGARYQWDGNRKAGAGSMEILGSTAMAIDIRLSFLKPWKATNQVTFSFTPDGDGTDVGWRMDGEQRGLLALFSRLFPMERMVGKDFEKGLAQLKAAAEG